MGKLSFGLGVLCVRWDKNAFPAEFDYTQTARRIAPMRELLDIVLKYEKQTGSGARGDYSMAD